MGMKQGEITSKLDEIIDFAGVSDFIDTPVKRYSSGMHARLGFAIASHMDPEVLIIDEVLAVGDVAFQQRCEERMLRFIREGVALAFVSHNLQAVSRLCSKAILLERGEVKASRPDRGGRPGLCRRHGARTVRPSTARSLLPASELIGGGSTGHSVTVRAGDEVSLRLNISANEGDLTSRVRIHREARNGSVWSCSHQQHARARSFGLASLAGRRRSHGRVHVSELPGRPRNTCWSAGSFTCRPGGSNAKSSRQDSSPSRTTGCTRVLRTSTPWFDSCLR